MIPEALNQRLYTQLLKLIRRLFFELDEFDVDSFIDNLDLDDFRFICASKWVKLLHFSYNHFMRMDTNIKKNQGLFWKRYALLIISGTDVDEIVFAKPDRSLYDIHIE